MNYKVCHFIIDSGSYENVVLEDTIHKLSLKAEIHPSSYQLVWLKQSYEIKVFRRALVLLSIRTTYKDDIYSDIYLVDRGNLIQMLFIMEKIILIVFTLRIERLLFCLRNY